MKYRDNMTPEEEKQLLDACDKLDAAYADAVESEVVDEDYEDPNDFIGMGWVGKNGRP